jgi:hypothetical protein
MKQRTGVRAFLAKAAGRCGGALNSSLVVPGKKYGLSCDLEEPIIGSEAQQPSGAAERAAHAHGNTTQSKTRGVMSDQQEETAFMTLICYECSEATYASIVQSAKSVKPP